MPYGVKLERLPAVPLSPHRGAPTREEWKEWALRQKRPLAVDLFSGGGGLSFGLERAGFRVVLAADTDSRSLETHRHNFQGAAEAIDLSTDKGVAAVLQRLDGLPIALVAGGPPCQPYSRAGRSKIRHLVRAGKRDANDHRRGLWEPFLRVVEGVRPGAVLLENVPDMALADDLAALREILDRLAACSYRPEARLIDAWRHGVPQHRQRLIIVAVQEGRTFEWPGQRPRVTVRDAIHDLPQIRGTTGHAKTRYRGAHTAFQKRARVGMVNGDIHTLWDHVTRRVRDDDRDAFCMMKPHTRYTDLPEDLRRYRDDIFEDKYKRLGWNELSRSITAHLAKDGYWYIHPSQPRTLSVREAARIQTFPDRFRFAGTRSDAYRQIGNAVPPALAEAVASELRRSLRRHGGAAGAPPLPDVAIVRQRLSGWLNSSAPSGPWRHHGKRWATLVSVVLDGRTAAPNTLTPAFLSAFPEPASLDRVAGRAWALPFGDRAVARAIALSRAARDLAESDDAWASMRWAEKSDLSGSQVQAVRLVGLGDDGVLLGAATLRVVNRLVGGRARSRADASMLLAQFVGTGDDVPARNAAIWALGATICVARRRRCRICPLSDVCRTALRSQRRAPGPRRATPARAT